MFIEPDLKEIGPVNSRSEKLLEELTSYDWKNTYDSYLKNTGAIMYPFKGGRCDFYYKHEDVSEKELQILALTVPFLKEINQYFPRYRFIKGEIYCAFPNSEQQPHIDPKVFHRFCHRIHIPLISNDQSFLQVDQNHYHLEPYKIYDFNNLKMHRSYNRGTTIRIHIVVDIMDEFYFTKFFHSGKYLSLFDRSDNDGTNLDSYYRDLVL